MWNYIKNSLPKTIIALLAVFLGAINVFAETKCSYQEKADLLDAASKVKTAYEIEAVKVKADFIDPESGEMSQIEREEDEFVISIYNITEGMNITQVNSVTKEQVDILYSSTENGVYTFRTKDLENIVTYTYSVYSSTENCSGERLKTYTFQKPKFNVFSIYGVCVGKEDVPYCQSYITKDLGISEGNLANEINNYLEDKSIKQAEDEDTNAILDFLKDNYIYIIIGVVLVGGATAGTIYFVKKRSAL